MTRFFVTFEGGEGAGKTTLIQKLEKELIQRQVPYLVTREPGGTFLGEKIRSLLLDRTEPISAYAELALFLASRAEHVEKKILPALNESKIVLCDRFNDSSVVYQGFARDLGMMQVASTAHFLSHSLKPDLTFYLDIDPEIGLSRVVKRGKADAFEQEDLSFHQKIREGYLTLCQMEPDRICKIDASKSSEEVYQEVLTRLSFLI